MIVNEALYYGKKLSHSLLNPNQLRHFGVGFWDNPYDVSHELSIEIKDGPIIPMHYEGTKLTFQSQVPTDHELNTLPHLNLTSTRPWEPHSVVLGEVHQNPKRNGFVANISTVMLTQVFNDELHEAKSFYHDTKMDESILNEINPVLVQLKEIYTNVNESLYNPNVTDLPARKTFVSTDRHKQAAAMTLCENW